jgi:hypothetical protein
VTMVMAVFNSRWRILLMTNIIITSLRFGCKLNTSSKTGVYSCIFGFLSLILILLLKLVFFVFPITTTLIRLLIFCRSWDLQRFPISIWSLRLWRLSILKRLLRISFGILHNICLLRWFIFPIWDLTFLVLGTSIWGLPLFFTQRFLVVLCSS